MCKTKTTLLSLLFLNCSSLTFPTSLIVFHSVSDDCNSTRFIGINPEKGNQPDKNLHSKYTHLHTIEEPNQLSVGLLIGQWTLLLFLSVLFWQTDVATLNRKVHLKK